MSFKFNRNKNFQVCTSIRKYATINFLYLLRSDKIVYYIF